MAQTYASPGNYASSTLTANGSLAKDQTSRQTAQDALTHQEQALAELHQSIAQLGNRLDPVLVSMPPLPANAVSDGPAPTPANLYDRMMQHGQIVQRATHRIVNLLDRLQL
jgi:predicted component of type VI protein secretion system